MIDDPQVMTGGGLRLDLLDPSIARLTRWADTPADALQVSRQGSLAEASQGLQGWLQAGWQGRGIWRGPTILPRHDHNTFGRSRLLQPMEVKVMSVERERELRTLEFNVKRPRRKDYDHRLETLLEEVTPQFTLRNVERVELETNLPWVPFRDEIWRDADEYGVTLGAEQVLTYRPPDMSYTLSWERLEELRAQKREVVVELDWHNYHGRWRQDFKGPARLFNPAVFATPRIKGRFATPEELLEEYNHGRKRRYRVLPRHIIRYYRL